MARRALRQRYGPLRRAFSIGDKLRIAKPDWQIVKRLPGATYGRKKSGFTLRSADPPRAHTTQARNVDLERLGDLLLLPGLVASAHNLGGFAFDDDCYSFALNEGTLDSLHFIVAVGNWLTERNNLPYNGQSRKCWANNGSHYVCLPDIGSILGTGAAAGIPSACYPQQYRNWTETGQLRSHHATRQSLMSTSSL
jgi:hypothetical protein